MGYGRLPVPSYSQESNTSAFNNCTAHDSWSRFLFETSLSIAISPEIIWHSYGSYFPNELKSFSCFDPSRCIRYHVDCLMKRRMEYGSNYLSYYPQAVHDEIDSHRWTGPFRWQGKGRELSSSIFIIHDHLSWRTQNETMRGVYAHSGFVSHPHYLTVSQPGLTV